MMPVSAPNRRNPANPREDAPMPGNVRPVTSERDGLMAFLAQQRYLIRLAGYGLTDDQARVPLAPGGLTVGGLIKHVADVESSWIDTLLQIPSQSDEGDYEANFRLGSEESL